MGKSREFSLLPVNLRHFGGFQALRGHFGAPFCPILLRGNNKSNFRQAHHSSRLFPPLRRRFSPAFLPSLRTSSNSRSARFPAISPPPHSPKRKAPHTARLCSFLVLLPTVSRRHQPPTLFCPRWFDAALRCPSPQRSAAVAARPSGGDACQTSGISFSPSARDSSVGGASLSSPFI